MKLLIDSYGYISIANNENDLIILINSFNSITELIILLVIIIIFSEYPEFYILLSRKNIEFNE
uniref:Uncharacterized protein orf62b n=1 Tax=Chara vulgaris TaxID=55564 RepID=Q1ACJ8_CHAVU|nr:hypothetical protein ChvuCp046 [Chara vulgaris]ABA61992.1 hypothetical protein [Chara vulgaris]